MKKIEEFEHFIGMSENDARLIYKNLRVVEVDGRYCIITDDLNPERLNVIIEKNIITKIDGLY